MWFEFVGIITLNWLISHRPPTYIKYRLKSSCINMSFDWICLACRDDESSVS